MIEATLADMRNSRNFFKTDEIIHILDGRKKENIGFFVPQVFKEEVEKLAERIEKKKRSSLLNRIAKAQQLDPITEGGVGDGIK